MKFKYLLILFLNISVAYGQQGYLQGHVVDAQSGLPIADANISVPAKNLFYPTNNEGEFNIIDNSISKTDSINISCIGYQTLKVKYSDLTPGGNIKLTVLVKVLREVKIGLVQCGSKMKLQDLWAAYHPLNEHAMFMNGSKNVKGTILSVGFYLGSAEGGDAIAPFRVKIYGVNPDGTPGKELTKDIIVVSAKKNNAWFDVDISVYDIQNPDGGFFVAFCLIDSKNYKSSKGTDMFTPRLGMTDHEFADARSYRGEKKHGKWEWYKESFTFNYMIRASIVPE
jgi:hypothetical protein